MRYASQRNASYLRKGHRISGIEIIPFLTFVFSELCISFTHIVRMIRTSKYSQNKLDFINQVLIIN